MRGEREAERDTIAIIGRKIQEMESQLNSVHVQTRMPPEMEDSGLFMEEDEDDAVDSGTESKDETPNGMSPNHMLSFEDVFNPPKTDENRHAEHDHLIAEAQQVLENVRKVEENLRQRHVELQELHARYNTQAEDVDRTLEDLEGEKETLQNDNQSVRTENAALKQDLTFDQTELLWLQMQFKALQVEVQVSDEGAERMEGYAPGLRDEIRKVKRERIAREMKRWQSDWEDVEKNMKGRRKHYDLFSDNGSKDDAGINGSAVANEGDTPSDWRLAMVKKGHGKVQQLVVTRVHAETGEPFDEAEDLLEEDMTAHEELSVAENLPAVETIPEDDVPDTPVENNYVHRSTQTEEDEVEADSTASWLFVEEHLADQVIPGAVDDCAITTSSEDNDEFPSSDDEADPSPRSPLQTAWQELWTGLTNLAGMGDDDFH
jgi:hypothetical protein